MSPQSKYCYPGTEILINIPGIKDQKALTRFENIVATTRNTQPGELPVNGKFDLEHPKNIHFFLFQDVYLFAGEIRSENISKDGFPFARVEYIIPQAHAIFESLRNDRYMQDRAADEFSVGAAKYMADLNVQRPSPTRIHTLSRAESRVYIRLVKQT